MLGSHGLGEDFGLRSRWCGWLTPWRREEIDRPIATTAGSSNWSRTFPLRLTSPSFTDRGPITGRAGRGAACILIVVVSLTQLGPRKAPTGVSIAEGHTALPAWVVAATGPPRGGRSVSGPASIPTGDRPQSPMSHTDMAGDHPGSRGPDFTAARRWDRSRRPFERKAWSLGKDQVLITRSGEIHPRWAVATP